MKQKCQVFNLDCIEGMKQHVVDNSVDLIFTDPPYGIEGGTLDKHYAREESHVIPGYVDVPYNQYEQFSLQWIKQCERVLRPGGSLYIVSGYTGLRHILNALAATSLEEVNHIIAEYSFGVSTKTKWVSSHYHVLYYIKPPLKNKTFNTFCRFTDIGDSYHDRLSVQKLNREYKPGQLKNKNQLPESFVEKFILYSSKRGDIVLDPFLGGFTTAKIALQYGRKIIGFEINKYAYDVFSPLLKQIKPIPDPESVSPSKEEMEKRLKKRAGYKRARTTKETRTQVSYSKKKSIKDLFTF